MLITPIDWKGIPVSLKKRLLLVAGFLVLIASLAAWVALQRLSGGIIAQWGEQLVAAQVRHDASQIAQSLEQKLALARQLASSSLLRGWAARLDDTAYTHRVKETLEQAGLWDGRQSVFIALLDSRAFFYRFSGDPLGDSLPRRALDYSLDAALYRQAREGQEVQQEVIRDSASDQARLWIRVLLRDAGQIKGVLGIGIPMDSLLPKWVNPDQPGMISLFVDAQDRVQLYRASGMLELARDSVRFQAGTLDLLIDEPQERQRIRNLQQQLGRMSLPDSLMLSDIIQLRGQPFLMGVAYMPLSGWYNLTLLDLDRLLPFNRLIPVVVVFCLVLLITLLLLHTLLCHLLFNPLAALERAMGQLRAGNALDNLNLPQGEGEMGQLIQQFAAIAAQQKAVEHEDLTQRTEALERLVRIDPLTELLNRRGMAERMDAELERARRHGYSVAILWLDVDRFKEINDSFGHLLGDQALQTVAKVLRQCLRSYDHAARWGGDEFLVLLSPGNEQTLLAIGERIRQLVEQISAQDCALTVSIGAHLTQPDESLELALHCADQALYAAKRAGRNQLCLYSAAAFSQTS